MFLLSGFNLFRQLTHTSTRTFSAVIKNYLLDFINGLVERPDWFETNWSVSQVLPPSSPSNCTLNWTAESTIQVLSRTNRTNKKTQRCFKTRTRLDFLMGSGWIWGEKTLEQKPGAVNPRELRIYFVLMVISCAGQFTCVCVEVKERRAGFWVCLARKLCNELLAINCNRIILKFLFNLTIFHRVETKFFFATLVLCFLFY